jgi:hypothetical protein
VNRVADPARDGDSESGMGQTVACRMDNQHAVCRNRPSTKNTIKIALVYKPYDLGESF